MPRKIRKSQSEDANESVSNVTLSGEALTSLFSSLQQSQAEFCRALLQEVRSSTPVASYTCDPAAGTTTGCSAAALHVPASGNFSRCTARFSGSSAESLENFLDAVEVYKTCLNVTDENALRGLSMLLTNDAAVWWQGVKASTNTWTEGLTRIRSAFGERRLPYQIYKELFSLNQGNENTDLFIAKVRSLLAKLPTEDLSERVQIDMCFGLLDRRIRKRLDRCSITTFDELLCKCRAIEDARKESIPDRVNQPFVNRSTHPVATPAVEDIIIEGAAAPGPVRNVPSTSQSERSFCVYCKRKGHTRDNCSKLNNNNSKGESENKISCFGCGAANVVRSKCVKCNPTQSGHSFYSVGIRSTRGSRAADRPLQERSRGSRAADRPVRASMTRTDRAVSTLAPPATAPAARSDAQSAQQRSARALSPSSLAATAVQPNPSPATSVKAQCNGGPVMADGVGDAEACAGESAARGAALERAYVHDVYEQAGEEGDELPRPPAPAVRAFLSDLEPGSLVCDVGCGNGKYLNVNPSVFAVGGDRCTRLAAHAKHHNNEVVVCDNLCLPYRDESFDAVLSIAVVHHFATVERRAKALRELARVTRIGGRLLLTVWAMEHEGRNFHSQDVLIPWHRPVTLCPPTPAPRFLSVDHDHNAEPWKCRDGSPGSSSLSSPNETCYSFVRRALSRLAGRRSFLQSWSLGNRVPTRPCIRPEPPAADLPIELRRLDDAMPPRLMPQPSESSTMKSRSLTDIADVERHALVRSRSSLPSLACDDHDPPPLEVPKPEVTEPRKKPRLVKQKKSINEDDAEEDLDKPTDMKSLVEEMPNFKIHTQRLQSKKPGVFKQTSLNEELMSVERLREKERLRKNIQKQASLNEEYLYHRPGALDSIRDSIFSTSATTAKKFQSLKNGLTSKFKTSTTNIDKVTVFVRMLQGWKSHGPVPEVPTPSDNNTGSEKGYPERRHSREDGSDSSKDSSLQSDTSVDSEDSFASVIYVPKADGTGDPLSPTPLSPGPTSPRLKVSSVPTSPRMKSSPGLPSPRIKQAFPLIRPPASPSSIQAPTTVNKILVAQYSLKNYSTSTSVCTVPIKPQSKSQPNSPPKSESDDKMAPKPEPLSVMNRHMSVEVFEDVDPIPPIKEEEEEPPTEMTKELIAEINKDIEEIHKLTAETEQLQPQVVLQDIKPYPKITLQTVAELPEIPQYKAKGPNKSPSDTLDSRVADKKRKERIRQIKEMLNKGIPAANLKSRRQPFPFVRSNGKLEPFAKTRSTLMSLELFNPATDDMDSDSSGVSSPDSVDSVISVVPEELRKTALEKDLPSVITTEVKDEEALPEKCPSPTPPLSLIEAAAEVAQSLDDTCETVIQSSPKSKRKHLDKLESAEAMAIVQGISSSSSSSNWSLNKLSPGDLRILEDRSRSHSHTSSSGSSSSLERLSPGRRSKDRSPKLGSTSNSTWSLNRLSPNRPEGRSLDENLSKSHRSPTRLPYDSVSISSTDSDKSISKSESFNRIQANEPLVTCKSDMLANKEDWVSDQQDRGQHLTEFAEKLSEKLLQEIDQYSKRINEEDFDLPSSSSSEKSISLRLKREEEDRNTQKILDELSDSLQHLEDPYVNKLSTDIQGLNKLGAELHERQKYIAAVNDTQETDITKLFPKCGSKTKSKKRSKDVDPIINKYRELKKSMKVASDEDILLNNCVNIQYNLKPMTEEKLADIDTKNPDDDSAICSSNGNPEITIDSGNYDTSQSLETGYSLESEISVDSLCTSTDKRSSLKVGQSTDSSDIDKMEISPESMTSRSSTSTAPLKSGFSIESSDTSAGSDWSRRDKTGSTASLGCVSLASLPSCSECSKERKLLETRSSSEDTATIPVPSRALPHAPLLPSLSDGSDSLPSEGGAVTYHRYYHVFKRGELDQLIEKYVESLHVVSSYYDQASWCVIAEKVQVWTI